MVAGDPDHRRAQARGDRLDRGTEGGVCLGLAEIGQVAREDDRVGTDAEGLDRLEGPPQVRRGVVATTERHVFRKQVGVAEVQDRSPRGGILTELHGCRLHVLSLRPVSDPTLEPGQWLKTISSSPPRTASPHSPKEM